MRFICFWIRPEITDNTVYHTVSAEFQPFSHVRFPAAWRRRQTRKNSPAPVIQNSPAGSWNRDWFYHSTLFHAIIASRRLLYLFLWPDDSSQWPIIPFRCAPWYNSCKAAIILNFYGRTTRPDDQLYHSAALHGIIAAKQLLYLIFMAGRLVPMTNYTIPLRSMV